MNPADMNPPVFGMPPAPPAPGPSVPPAPPANIGVPGLGMPPAPPVPGPSVPPAPPVNASSTSVGNCRNVIHYPQLPPMALVEIQGQLHWVITGISDKAWNGVEWISL